MCGKVLAEHFPPGHADKNELPNHLIVLEPGGDDSDCLSSSRHFDHKVSTVWRSQPAKPMLEGMASTGKRWAAIIASFSFRSDP